MMNPNIAKTKARARPRRSYRNSAQLPYRWAMILCAISCNPTPVATATSAAMNVSPAKAPRSLGVTRTARNPITCATVKAALNARIATRSWNSSVRLKWTPGFGPVRVG